MEIKSDEILIKEVKEGNLDSMIPLFEKYQVPLFNFFLRATRCKSTSEDLTHGVFSRILEYRGSFREGNAIRSWICQMARNLLIDNYHKNKHYVDRDDDFEGMLTLSLTFLSPGGFAQRLVEKSVEVGQNKEISLDFQFADEINITGWDKPEVMVKL